MGELTVMTSDTDGAVHVRVRGELDIATAERLERAIAAAEGRAASRRLVLDYSGLDFMDSTGLQVLLDTDIRAERDGRVLELVVGDGEAHRVLTLADVLPRLRVAAVR